MVTYPVITCIAAHHIQTQGNVSRTVVTIMLTPLDLGMVREGSRTDNSHQGTRSWTDSSHQGTHSSQQAPQVNEAQGGKTMTDEQNKEGE